MVKNLPNPTRQQTFNMHQPSNPLLQQLDPKSDQFVHCSPLDLSADTLLRLQLDPTDDAQLRPYIFNGHLRFGGYGEVRSIYTRSDHFSTDSEPRNIHLGIDLWWHAGTPIFTPLDGQIVGVANNNKAGDYGHTLIAKHSWNGESIYVLYGHLSKSILSQWKAGDTIAAGTLLAVIGESNENGGWLPHLHFQLIRDLQGNTTDFPGVCSKSQWDTFKDICPDPTEFLSLDSF